MKMTFALIERYLQTVDECISRMKNRYQRNDILTAYRGKAIPKSASIDGMLFEFHGVGCWFKLNDIECEMDFRSENRTDGFDAWRLSEYAQQFENLRDQ